MERFARNNTPGPSDGPSLEDERRGCPDSLSASELYLWMDGGDINQETAHWKILFMFFFFFSMEKRGKFEDGSRS